MPGASGEGGSGALPLACTAAGEPQRVAAPGGGSTPHLGLQHAQGPGPAVSPLCPSLAALQQLEAAAAAAARDAAVEEEDGGGSSRDASPTRGSPRKGRGSSSGGGGGPAAEVQRCNFTHLLALQLSPPEEDAQGRCAGWNGLHLGWTASMPNAGWNGLNGEHAQWWVHRRGGTRWWEGCPTRAQCAGGDA